MPNRNKTSYEFSLTPVHKNNIPPFNVLLQAANALLASSVRWPPGKTYYDGTVQTFTQKSPSGPNWHGRLSYHPIEQGTFAEFWEVIGVRHCQAQEEYVPELVSATHLEPYMDGDYDAWTFHYNYSPPLSPRTFTVLLATSLDDKPPRQGWVISIPFDVGENEGLKALEEKGVRGRFTTVERLLEVDGKVEWMAVTMNQIGGSIPNFISERGMPKQFSERVGQVLEYIAARREGQSGRKPKLALTQPGSSSSTPAPSAAGGTPAGSTIMTGTGTGSEGNTPETAACPSSAEPTSPAQPQA